MRKILLCIVACCVLLSGCAVAENAQSGEYTKAVVIELNIKGGIITERGSHVVYGFPPDNIANIDFRVELEGEDASVLKTLGIEDPRILYYDDSAELVDDVDFSIIVPFYEDLKRVNVYEGTTNKLMISVDVVPAIDEFCSAHPNDPECAPAGPTPEPTPAPVRLTTVLLALSIAALIAVQGRKKSQ